MISSIQSNIVAPVARKLLVVSNTQSQMLNVKCTAAESGAFPGFHPPKSWPEPRAFTATLSLPSTFSPSSPLLVILLVAHNTLTVPDIVLRYSPPLSNPQETDDDDDGSPEKEEDEEPLEMTADNEAGRVLLSWPSITLEFYSCGHDQHFSSLRSLTGFGMGSVPSHAGMDNPVTQVGRLISAASELAEALMSQGAVIVGNENLDGWRRSQTSMEWLLILELSVNPVLVVAMAQDPRASGIEGIPDLIHRLLQLRPALCALPRHTESLIRPRWERLVPSLARPSQSEHDWSLKADLVSAELGYMNALAQSALLQSSVFPEISERPQSLRTLFLMLVDLEVRVGNTGFVYLTSGKDAVMEDINDLLAKYPRLPRTAEFNARAAGLLLDWYAILIGGSSEFKQLRPDPGLNHEPPGAVVVID